MKFFDDYLDAYQAAGLLGCHPETIKRQIRKGTLPAIKVANKWFIERSTFYEFIKDYVPKKGRPRKG